MSVSADVKKNERKMMICIQKYSFLFLVTRKKDQKIKPKKLSRSEANSEMS